jgi:hypothetical protein
MTTARDLPNPFMPSADDQRVADLAAACEAELAAYLDRRDGSAAGLLFLQPSFNELLPYRPPPGAAK